MRAYHKDPPPLLPYAWARLIARDGAFTISNEFEALQEHIKSRQLKHFGMLMALHRHPLGDKSFLVIRTQNRNTRSLNPRRA